MGRANRQHMLVARRNAGGATLGAQAGSGVALRGKPVSVNGFPPMLGEAHTDQLSKHEHGRTGLVAAEQLTGNALISPLGGGDSPLWPEPLETPLSR